MQIDNINNTSFQAKLVHTKDLMRVVQYAKNDSALLNELLTAEKNINRVEPKTKLIFELFQTVNNLPFVILTRVKSLKGVKAATQERDFIDYEPIIILSKKQMEPLKFGFNVLKKIGHKTEQNSFYKRVVLGKDVDINTKKYELV